jgi:hypothetical protein
MVESPFGLSYYSDAIYFHCGQGIYSSFLFEVTDIYVLYSMLYDKSILISNILLKKI